MTDAPGPGIYREWGARNRVLSQTLTDLVLEHAPAGARRALDVGCEYNGETTDLYARLTRLEWVGVDPVIDEPRRSAEGMLLKPGAADRLEFPDREFDVVMLANVYEHLLPDRRVASFREVRRVLADDGAVVGQIPNPYFPIESHSRLPFMGWLPLRAQKAYWKLAPVDWEHDFFRVTPRNLRRDAAMGGLRAAMVRKFNYPPEVTPPALRGVARALRGPMRIVPWAWQFVLVPG